MLPFVRAATAVVLCAMLTGAGVAYPAVADSGPVITSWFVLFVLVWAARVSIFDVPAVKAM